METEQCRLPRSDHPPKTFENAEISNDTRKQIQKAEEDEKTKLLRLFLGNAIVYRKYVKIEKQCNVQRQTTE